MTDYDLRSIFTGTVHNQGRRPVCVPLAVSAVHEAERTQRGGQRDDLAPEPIWAFCLSRGLAGASGMRLWDAELAVESQGQPTLVEWPFNPLLGNGTEPAPAHLGPAPWITGQVAARSSALDGKETALDADLAQGKGVAIVIGTSDELFDPDAAGFVSEPTRGFHGALHAVACCGAKTVAGRGRMLLVKNSWGDQWGLQGFGFVPISYLRAWQLRFD